MRKMLITEKIFDVSTSKETIIEREETADEKQIRETFEAERLVKQTEATVKAAAKAALH